MATATAERTRLDVKEFDSPDEVRTFEKGKIDVVTIGGTSVGRTTLQPGWKWSECVKPVVQTDSCEVAHLGYMLSGRMYVRMNDGTEYEMNAGEVGAIPPGHDAWVVGNETVVFLDFSGASQYAMRH